MTSVLPTGGLKGYVEFHFPDGWTVFLTSATGAGAFNAAVTPIFDVRDSQYYGGEYDMDAKIAARMKNLAAEFDRCRLLRKSIVLHCSHGRSRSVICLGAYLMLKRPTVVNRNAAAADTVNILRATFASAGAEGRPHYSELGNRVEPALTAFQHYM